MKSLRFKPSIDGFPGFHPAAAAEDLVFEVLIEARDARKLRATLMDMARIAASGNTQRVVLILEEPRLTAQRLLDEWAGAASVFQPALFSRLSIAVHRSGAWTGIPHIPDGVDLNVLEEILNHQLSEQKPSVGRGAESSCEILRLLVHQWLLGERSVAVGWLMETAGVSHPTVSRALARFEHCLIRHSDRSVGLRYFPRDEWAKLLAGADEIRATVSFAYHSGLKRSPESLLSRLADLNRKDIAVGGVLGALHYQPSLDLLGNPRLDLSLHSAGKQADLSFVERLDPALERTARRDESPSLVVHVIRRATSLFQPANDGMFWADPVECLLDLHEARLEAQALEFIDFFQRMYAHKWAPEAGSAHRGQSR